MNIHPQAMAQLIFTTTKEWLHKFCVLLFCVLNFGNMYARVRNLRDFSSFSDQEQIGHLEFCCLVFFNFVLLNDFLPEYNTKILKVRNVKNIFMLINLDRGRQFSR